MSHPDTVVRSPDGNVLLAEEEVCCAPAIRDHETEVALSSSEDVAFGGLQIDPLATVVVFVDPEATPVLPVPTLNADPVVIAPVPPVTGSITVDLDTSGSAGGGYIVQVINPCGCSATASFTVAIA